MLGLTEAEWVMAVQIYMRFFSEGQPNLQRSKGQCLLGRFSVLGEESSVDPLFWKTLYIPNREYKVAISTTSNPYTDWCGIFEKGVIGIVYRCLGSLPNLSKTRAPRVRQARDGIGSTLHDLADNETHRNSLFTPMT